MTTNRNTPISDKQWEEILPFIARAVVRDPKWAPTMHYVIKQLEVAKREDPVTLAQRILERYTDAGGRKAAR